MFKVPKWTNTVAMRSRSDYELSANGRVEREGRRTLGARVAGWGLTRGGSADLRSARGVRSCGGGTDSRTGGEGSVITAMPKPGRSGEHRLGSGGENLRGGGDRYGP